MDKSLVYLIIADSILIVHFLFIAFVIFGLIFVFIGAWLDWRWIRNIWFRTVHLLAIGIVVFQAWLNIICPLTIWENNFRAMAGDATYQGSFVEYWLHKLIFYQADTWVFVLCYTIFGGLVVASWYFFPPSRNPNKYQRE